MATAIIGEVVSTKSAKPTKADKKASKKPTKTVEPKADKKASGKPTKTVEPKADKKASEKPTVSVVKWNEKFREGTIGRQTADLIMEGKLSNEEILAEVRATHKKNTTLACVTWYKSKARKEGAID